MFEKRLPKIINCKVYSQKNYTKLFNSTTVARFGNTRYLTMSDKISAMFTTAVILLPFLLTVLIQTLLELQVQDTILYYRIRFKTKL